MVIMKTSGVEYACRTCRRTCRRRVADASSHLERRGGPAKAREVDEAVALPRPHRHHPQVEAAEEPQRGCDEEQDEVDGHEDVDPGAVGVGRRFPHRDAYVACHGRVMDASWKERPRAPLGTGRGRRGTSSWT